MGADTFVGELLPKLKSEYEARPATDPDKLWVLQSVGVLETHRQQMVQTGLHVGGYI